MIARQKLLRLLIALSTASLGALVAPAADAHPHVWVTARAEIIFDHSGLIKAVRNTWVFDEMYSAFATEGLGKNGKPPTPEELAPLAKTNIDSLAEFDDFTFIKVAGAKAEFGEPIDYSLEARTDKIVVLHFTLPLKTPASAKKAFSLQEYDPTYFVAFSLEAKDPITLVDAPAGCSANVLGASPLQASDSQKLSAALAENFSPGADFAIKLADRVIVACP